MLGATKSIRDALKKDTITLHANLGSCTAARGEVIAARASLPRLLGVVNRTYTHGMGFAAKREASNSVWLTIVVSNFRLTSKRA
jgi:hypothetical protein